MQTRHVYVRDLLVALGAPGTLENAAALIAQMQAEGGQAKFNPLNTTVKAPGSTDYNTVHVQNFVSWTQGVATTAKTLEQANMVKLHSALMKGNSALTYWQALAVSPWGTKPPSGYTIEAWLSDVDAHWFDRSMQGISGT